MEQDTVGVEMWNRRGALGRTQGLHWRVTAELVPPCLAVQGSPDARVGCGKTGTPLIGSDLGSRSDFGGLSAADPTARSHQSPEAFLSNRLRKGYEVEVQGRSSIGLKRLELRSHKYPLV